jgi:hypothetical protein
VICSSDVSITKAEGENVSDIWNISCLVRLVRCLGGLSGRPSTPITETGKGSNRGPKWLRPVFSEVILRLNQAPRHEVVCERADIAPCILHHDTRGGECSASRPGPPHVRQRVRDAHCIRGWVGPRTDVGIGDKKHICQCRESKPYSHLPGRGLFTTPPALSQFQSCIQNFVYFIPVHLTTLSMGLIIYSSVEWQNYWWPTGKHVAKRGSIPALPQKTKKNHKILPR